MQKYFWLRCVCKQVVQAKIFENSVKCSGFRNFFMRKNKNGKFLVFVVFNTPPNKCFASNFRAENVFSRRLTFLAPVALLTVLLHTVVSRCASGNVLSISRTAAEFFKSTAKKRHKSAIQTAERLLFVGI